MKRRSKFLNDSWMVSRDFMQPTEKPAVPGNFWWWNRPVSALPLTVPATLPVSASVEQALERLDRSHSEYVLVEDAGHEKGAAIVGALSTQLLLSALLKKAVSRDTPVEKVMFTQFRTVTAECSLAKLSSVLEVAQYAVVVNGTHFEFLN